MLRGEGPIVIGESYAIRHQTSSQSWMSLSAYGLIGYSVTDKLTLYGAADVIQGGDDDPFFRPDPAMAPPVDVLELLAGVRIDTSTWSALKLELQYEHQPADRDDDYSAVINWAFGL